MMFRMLMVLGPRRQPARKGPCASVLGAGDGAAFLSRPSCAFRQMRSCHRAPPPRFVPGTSGYN